MMIPNVFFLTIVIFSFLQSFSAITLAEEFKEKGYVEICDETQGSKIFDSLYSVFDEFIEFLQKNTAWAQKLYSAKERFIRSKERNYYSTDFFGFYDESEREGRKQIAFYYSTHFHDFIVSYYPECNKIPQIISFFEACLKIQKSCEQTFNKAAADLGLEKILCLKQNHPPLLIKVVKYFSSYSESRPHYDGTSLSLFLDSTDNEALFLSPYRSSFSVADFFSPKRSFSRNFEKNSIVLIPGAFLTEFSIYPSPHIVLSSGKIRYATIAFALRPYYIFDKNDFPSLPIFKY